GARNDDAAIDDRRRRCRHGQRRGLLRACALPGGEAILEAAAVAFLEIVGERGRKGGKRQRSGSRAKSCTANGAADSESHDARTRRRAAAGFSASA
ncbi:MAG: hypothetical protein JNM90_02590, partial [Burkholderiales bacterium]|nr:hypothetical protein [Burkholderiales bacterium]